MTSYWAKKKSFNTFGMHETPSHVASTYLPIYKTDANTWKLPLYFFNKAFTSLIT